MYSDVAKDDPRKERIVKSLYVLQKRWTFISNPV